MLCWPDSFSFSILNLHKYNFSLYQPYYVCDNKTKKKKTASNLVQGILRIDIGILRKVGGKVMWTADKCKEWRHKEDLVREHEAFLKIRDCLFSLVLRLLPLNSAQNFESPIKVIMGGTSEEYNQ